MPSTSEVRKAIHDRRAKWKAGKTSVSELAEPAFAGMLGLKVDPTDQEALVLASRAASTASEALLPKTMDWRNRDGCDWITPVRYQGACGSCVAFGVAAAMESAVRISLNDP